MKHRRAASVAATLIAGLMIAACGSAATDTNGSDTANAEQTAENDAGDFGTAKPGVFRVASSLSYPPLEMLDDNGEATGFEVELAEAVAERLDYTIEWVQADFSAIVPGVTSNKFDFAASGITGWMPPDSAATLQIADRLEQVNMTVPYYLYPSAIIVNSERTPDIQSVDDLDAGMTVGVTDGSHIFFWAKDVLVPKDIDIDVAKSGPESYSKLESGMVDAVIDVKGPAAEAIKGKTGLEIRDEIYDLTGGYGFAVAKDNLALTNALNDAIREYVASDDYATLFAKYFPDQEMDDLPDAPLTVEEARS